MINKIKKVIDKVRPALEHDGGSIEFVSFDKESGVVKVKLSGHCAHCPMSVLTLKEFVLSELVAAVPEVKNVEAV